MYTTKRKPSELLDIGDPYTAFCFDEACSYIYIKMKAGEEPSFKQKYTSFSDLYRQYV